MADYKKIAKSILTRPKDVIKNANTRMTNAQNAGMGWQDQIGAAFAPNSTGTGNYFANWLAPQAQASGSGTIGDYTVQPNGKGGLNYFANGQPITREQFANGSGSDVGSLEQQAYNDFLNSQQGGDGGGGDGSGGTTAVLGSVTFRNKYRNTTTTYNLDDPAQAGAYYNDKLDAFQTERDQLVSEGRASSEKQKSELDTQLNDTYQEAKGYVDTYLTNVNEFGDQYQMGNVKRQQFFAGLSPNAYQSSQGTSQEYASNKYIEGLGQYAKEANQNVGSAFLANAQQNPNAPDYSTLDTNSAFGRNVAGIKGAKQDVEAAFNKFYDTSQENVYQQAADTKNSLLAIDQYGHKVDPLSKATLNQVNNSGITPYTTFQQGGLQTPVQGSAPVTYGTTPINTQAPLDQFLGQNKLTAKSKDYLAAWLSAHA